MTTLNEARDLVYKTLLDNYNGVPKEHITLENEDFKTPDNSSWLRLSIKTTSRRQYTLGGVGNRRFKTKAYAYMQIFTPINIGTKMGDLLAIEAANIFEGKRFDGLVFGAANVQEMGPDGKWYFYLVESRFDYFETK